MLSSLLSTVTNRLLKRGSRRTDSGSGRPHPGSTSLTLEALEDRCVLSAVTTLPSATNVLNPLTVPLDVLMASLPKGNPQVVVLGDSIAAGYGYGTGMPVWSAIMAPLGAVDWGVGNQTTQTLLYQISLGQLVGIDPAVVVLIIGTNNLVEGDSPAATAAGILADVGAIHRYLPEAQVLVLGTPPANPRPNDPFRIQTVQTDALAQQMLAGDSHAVFVNIAPVLEQPDGTISNLMLFDYMHPTELGYFELTLALLPSIEQASVVSNSRMQAALWNGFFGAAFVPFQLSSRAEAAVSTGLRAFIL